MNGRIFIGYVEGPCDWIEYQLPGESVPSVPEALRMLHGALGVDPDFRRRWGC